MDNELAITAKLALLDAATDLGHWFQLAETQRAAIPNADFCPYAPTEAGIRRSKEVRIQIFNAIDDIAKYLDGKSGDPRDE